ncbi:MAG: FecR family protein [Sphingobacterium composti]
MQKDRLNQLLHKYHQNKLSEVEKSELFDFLQDEDALELLNTSWNDGFVSSSSSINIDEDSLFDKIIQNPRLDFKNQRSNIPKIKQYQLAIAASIISILVTAISVWLYRNQNNVLEDLVVGQMAKIVPGGKLARMQFEDGTFVAFDNIQRDTILEDKGVRINVSSDGAISYEIINKSKELNYTTVYTPRGGEYSLTLSDGSQVWLNSESKIKYPLEFNKDYREVEIEGEAYFDVVSKTNGTKKVPFRVQTNSQVIEVLGTQFNVNAYSNNIYTTLIEGSVAVSNNLSKEKLVLLPSQQCVYSSNDGNMKKSDVDPYYFVAWRSGKFAFRSATIHQVMEDLARWYDVEVTYQGDFRNITYSGSISKLENFDEVLKLIELTNKFKFKIEGRRVTVTKA